MQNIFNKFIVNLKNYLTLILFDPLTLNIKSSIKTSIFFNFKGFLIKYNSF
jgi:hypothetical protein